MFRLAGLVPTYNNEATIASVVGRLLEHVDEVIVVDDGGTDASHAVCASLASSNVHVVHRQTNGGKGAAVKSGFARAIDLGFSHVLQVDADGQHNISRAPEFIAACVASPSSLILGCPVYDESAPMVRLKARRVTKFWVDLELGGPDLIVDAMVGFRVYPLEAVALTKVRSNRMDFDVEIAVRLARAGVPVINLPVEVRYLSEEEGGRSHFQPWRDNLRLIALHSRLCTEGVNRWILRKLFRSALPETRR